MNYMSKFILIKETDPNSTDAVHMIDELSDSLQTTTGNNGKNSFSVDDVCVPRSLFVLAFNDKDEAVGCGAIRPLNEQTAEVKRMYAKEKAAGIGTKVLTYLESKALEFGYTCLRLETRLINLSAVEFYRNRGYHQIPNYGKYVNRLEAICFEKQLCDDKERTQ